MKYRKVVQQHQDSHVLKICYKLNLLYKEKNAISLWCYSLCAPKNGNIYPQHDKVMVVFLHQVWIFSFIVITMHKFQISAKLKGSRAGKNSKTIKKNKKDRGNIIPVQ